MENMKEKVEIWKRVSNTHLIVVLRRRKLTYEQNKSIAIPMKILQDTRDKDKIHLQRKKALSWYFIS